jgi:tRNA modification GTPase
LIYEAPKGLTNEDEKLAREINHPFTFYVANKSDLGHEAVAEQSAIVSAMHSTGFGQLMERIRSRFESGHGVPLVNERHMEDLTEAAGQIESAAKTLSSDLPADLACVDLYGALNSLGRISGASAPHEIIERVFSQFCIGK